MRHRKLGGTAMRRTSVLIALLLAGCQETAGTVYDRPLPDRNDMEALLDIRDKLKPEDQEAWQGILMRKNNPMAEPITSKTVGEAVQRMRAKTACMSAHDVSKVPDNKLAIGDDGYDAAEAARITANNREVDAYNACLKMPV